MDCFARKDPNLELKRDLENINALAFSGQKVMNIKVYMGDDAYGVEIMPIKQTSLVWCKMVRK